MVRKPPFPSLPPTSMVRKPPFTSLPTRGGDAIQSL